MQTKQEIFETAAILQARAEMLRHLSQRIHRTPEKLIKHFMQAGPKSVWRKCLGRERRLQYLSGK